MIKSNRLSSNGRVGEVAAQGLYHGQALVARDHSVRALLEQAAREETDHLAWCEERLRELHDRRSLLHPFWYAGSFAIGVAAGLASDRVSLGFVAETEKQVEQHLDKHLQRLPTADARGRAILERMRADEQAHGQLARGAGGIKLPFPVRAAMQMASRVMTAITSSSESWRALSPATAASLTAAMVMRRTDVTTVSRAFIAVVRSDCRRSVSMPTDWPIRRSCTRR